MAANTEGAKSQKYANAIRDIMVRPVAEVTITNINKFFNKDTALFYPIELCKCCFIISFMT